jgi:hypothetical protein
VVERRPLDVDRLLSGESGIVLGRRARLRAGLADALDDAALWARMVPPRLDRAARAAPHGEVLVLGIYSTESVRLAERSMRELERSGRRLRIALGALDEPASALASLTVLEGLRGKGKFENLNALLEHVEATGAAPHEVDWTIVVDDDVELPRGFLDRFLFLAERFRFALAQPALRRGSHAAWAVLRRRRWTIARRTRLVEIGPLTAFSGAIAPSLLPFPPLRMGWGLDLHWGGLARDRDWRLGVIDATPIRHDARVTATAYDRAAAVAELRELLAERPHIDRGTALQVLERHRSWDVPSRSERDV